MHKLTNNKILKSGTQDHYSEGGACIGNSRKEYVCHYQLSIFLSYTSFLLKKILKMFPGKYITNYKNYVFPLVLQYCKSATCDIQNGFALRRHNSGVHISSSIDCLTFQLPDLSSHYKFEFHSIYES